MRRIVDLSLFRENIAQWPRNVRALIYASFAFYLLALGLPVATPGQGQESVAGWVALLLGWLVIVTGDLEFSWFANLALFVSWSKLTVGRPKPALFYSLLAVLLAISVVFGVFKEVVYTGSYWCWMASVLLNLVAVYSAYRIN